MGIITIVFKNASPKKFLDFISFIALNLRQLTLRKTTKTSSIKPKPIARKYLCANTKKNQHKNEPVFSMFFSIFKSS